MRPSLNDLLTDAASRLRAAGVENARHDAEELLCRACGLEDRSALFLNNDGKAEPALLSVFSSYIERRAAGEPLQYIMGEAWFYGRRFAVRPGALIPRPETELLAERAVARLRDTERRVMDLCTGSGAIAVTLALECPEARVTATDVSEAALACARENAAALGATEQIEFLHGDLFAALDFQAASCRPFDLIVCNPPYIPTGVIDTLQREVKDHEPRLALDGGADGLAFYERIAAEAPRYLKNGGTLLLEIGADQGDSVRRILEAAGFADVVIAKDLAGCDRIAEARSPQS